MFYQATGFNQPLEGWDTSSVTAMQDMFGGALSFSKPLAAWDTSSVETMRGRGLHSFTFQLNLSAFCE